MPSGIELLSTVQLLDIAEGVDTQTDYTPQEAFDELRERIVPQTDPATAWRGGIRPHHPNL